MLTNRDPNATPASSRSQRLFRLLLAAGLLLELLLAGAAWSQASGVGTIQIVQGQVEVVRGGMALAVQRGDFLLRSGDRVRTGPNGQARIVTVDGQRVTLGPNSEVELIRRRTRVRVGRVGVWITGRGRTEVGSPGGVAAARGTGFLVEVAADGLSTITVAEGEVVFSNEQGSVTLGPNQQSSARPGQPPSRPIAVDA